MDALIQKSFGGLLICKCNQQGEGKVVSMTELNPNHPTTMAAHEQWHKIVALLMLKMGVKEAVISPEEIARLEGSDTNIAIRFDDKVGIMLMLVNSTEARLLVRQEGGLPV